MAVSRASRARLLSPLPASNLTRSGVGEELRRSSFKIPTMTLADILHVIGETMPPAKFREQFRLTRLVTDAQINGAFSSVATAYVLPCVASASADEVDSELLSTASANLAYALMLTTTSEITRYTVVRANHEESQSATPAEITREVRRYRAQGIAALNALCAHLELEPSVAGSCRLLGDYL